MVRIGEDGFEDLAEQVAFCVGNLRDPACRLEDAGRFYEEAAEALRAHAILRLLLDADGDGFGSDLVMSGHARRGWLRRCARHQHADYFLALSRSGSLLDALAGDDPVLAAEVFSLSPAEYRKGDEYEEDFCWQRFVGLHLTGAPAAEVEALLARFDRVAEGAGARLALARAIHARDGAAFEECFQALLSERHEENENDAARADEEIAVAAGIKVFVEGLAVLKLARRDGLSVAAEYPMCPALALLPRKPASPPDEFAAP